MAGLSVPSPLSSLGLTAGDEEPQLAIRATSGEMPVTNLPEAEEAIRRLVDDGYRVVIAFEQRAEAERAGYVLRRVSREHGTGRRGGRRGRACRSCRCRTAGIS